MPLFLLHNYYAIKNRSTHGGGVIIQIQDSMSLIETHPTELEKTLLVSLQYKNTGLNWLLFTIHQEQTN